MKQLLSTFTFSIFIVTVFCQTEKTSESFELNTIYGEPFGQGFFGSLNYDRMLNTDKKVMNSFTIGIVYAPEAADFGDGQYFGIPICYNYILGKKNHHFATGIGGTALLSREFWPDFVQTTLYVYGVAKLGYRYQRPTGGLFFRADINVLVSIFSSDLSLFNDMRYFSDIGGIGFPIIPWPSLSLGYTF